MEYALDTNVISFLLAEKPNVWQNFDETALRGDNMFIPPIVHYEIKKGFYHQPSPRKENAYNILIRQFPSMQFPVGKMDQDVWEHAARLYADLRRTGRIVGDADILIAAFCIVNNYTLVTHNTRHFEGIDGLRIEDWAE